MPPEYNDHRKEGQTVVSSVRPVQSMNGRARTFTEPVDPIVLVFAADEQFVVPLAAALYSALDNLNRSLQPVVYIIDGGICESSRRRLRRVAERAHANVRLEFVAPDARKLEGYSLRVAGRFSSAVFLRLFIPDLLPAWNEKAIYLDSDTIVEKDLAELWREDVEDYAVLAVQERNVASRYGLFNWRELGLRADAPYFNSGILVINLRRWRAEHISTDVLQYLSQHRNEINLPHEQEGLNAVLAGRWGRIDPRWNLIYPFYNKDRFDRLPFAGELHGLRETFTRDPHVIHFNSAEKPWHPNCTHPARARFYEYLNRSQWFSRVQYYRFCLSLRPAQAAAATWHAAKDTARRLQPGTRRARERAVARRGDRHVNSAKATNTVVLVFAVDETFAMPMAVTLYSALVNLRKDYHPNVYVIDGGLRPDSRNRIVKAAKRARSQVDVDFIAPDRARLDPYSLEKEERFSMSIFLRLLIPELLPDEVNKAIYLDSDMVVEKDLSLLWDTEIGDHVVLAVQDVAIPHVASMPRGIHNWEALGLAHDTPYFNSGLLVLDLQSWRDESISGKILDYLSRHREHLNMRGNQEGYNAILANRWGMLDTRWNLIHHVYDSALYATLNERNDAEQTRRRLMRDPYVIHFTALKKPWEPNCIHPARDRFFHYLKRTGWYSQTEYVRLLMRLVPFQIAASLRYRLRIMGRPIKHALRDKFPTAGSPPSRGE